jgi:diguanylate cyclase (GGDEF)-like protein/PAS domain S-box-containing protein
MRNGSRKFYREILDHIDDGVYFVDRDGAIVYWNQAAARISGFAPEMVMGRRCRDNLLRHVDDQGNCLCLTGCPLSAAMADGQPRGASVFLHHRDGHRVPVSVRVNAITEEEGKIIGAVEVFNDNAAALAALERIKELEALAYLDSLTQVANRKYLEVFLSGKVNEMARHHLSFGLIFADLDHFKTINDTHGHVVGDQVLKMVAQTLAKNCRSFDLVGRWGGEEFLCILGNVGQEAQLWETGDRLRRLIKESFLTCGDSLIRITISMGGVLARPGDCPESLIKRADACLYQSKTAGRNRLVVG